MMVVTTNTDVSAVDLECGHRVYLADSFMTQRKRDHKTFYCTVCGSGNSWRQKSDLEVLRGRLASTTDMLNTARQQRDQTEYRRRAEKAAKTRIKNRVSKGVCRAATGHFRTSGGTWLRSTPAMPQRTDGRD